MKKIYTLNNVLIGVVILLLSSCQAEDDMLNVINPAVNADELAGTPVRLDASSFALSEVDTRAAATFPINGSTMTVGMTVNGTTTYANYTYDGTTWKADVTDGNKALRWGGADADHSFIAVSPKRDMSSLNFTLPTAYPTAAEVAACDGMLTTTAAVTTKPANSIVLTMEHALVKITILAKDGVTLKGQALSTTFNATTGALETVSHVDAIGTVTMYKSAESTFVGYILPRTTADGELAYNDGADKTFPATDMPAGSYFKCSVLESTEKTITSTAGGLKALLESDAVGATILHIEGEVNTIAADNSSTGEKSDMAALKAYLLNDNCLVEELYVDATGSEVLPIAFNNGTKGPSSLIKISFSKTTKIPDNAFKKCANLVSVSMPELQTLTNSAFNTCPKLKEINFPKVTSVSAGWALSDCIELETIYLPEFVTPSGNFFWIANCFAAGNVKLKAMIMPKLAYMPTRDNIADSQVLSALVLKTAVAFDKTKLRSGTNPTLFVTDAVSLENMNTALSGKYDGAKAYSTYNTSVPMTAESLIDPANYSVTWTKP